MEIVYAPNFNNLFADHELNVFYGDINDLCDMGIDIEGIVYDDKWSVKHFLKYLKNKKRIKGVLNYLDLDENILDKKIADLSKTEFKWVLLANILLNNIHHIIFDYFDTSLIYKDKKKFINIIHKLVNDDFNIIVISKDFTLMSMINKNIKVMNEEHKVDDISVYDLADSNNVDVPPILEFIKSANKKKAKLEITLDSKELLKDIYRGVK